MPLAEDRIDPMPAGASTTAGISGQSISFGRDLGTTDYHITLLLTQRPYGKLGDVWYSKSSTGFTLFNDGDSAISFTWGTQLF
jgi:hypothetical protein